MNKTTLFLGALLTSLASHHLAADKLSPLSTDDEIPPSVSPLPPLDDQEVERMVEDSDFNFSIDPVAAASSYELLWGTDPENLNDKVVGLESTFLPPPDLPLQERIYWRIDALTDTQTIEGKVKVFSSVAGSQQAVIEQPIPIGALSARKGTLSLLGDNRPTSSDASFWQISLSSPLPQKLNQSFFTGESTIETSTVAQWSLAGSGNQVFTFDRVTYQKFKKNDLDASYELIERKSLSNDLSPFSEIVESGDLVFMAPREADGPLEIIIYQTHPELTLEQVVRPPYPPNDFGVEPIFFTEIAASGNTLVISSFFDDFPGGDISQVWIYERIGPPNSPWQLTQTLSEGFTTNARVVTDGERIAIWGDVQSASDLSDNPLSIYGRNEDGLFSLESQWDWDDILETSQGNEGVDITVALDQNHLVISTMVGNSSPWFPNSMRTLLLRREDGGWMQKPDLGSEETRDVNLSTMAVADGRFFTAAVTPADSREKTLKLFRFDFDPTANQRPYFTSDPYDQVVAGKTERFEILVTDDSDDYQVFAEQLPTWMTLSEEDGSWFLTGTPPDDLGESAVVRLKVEDAEGVASYQTFGLELLPNEQLPEVALKANQDRLFEGQELILTASATGGRDFSYQWYLNDRVIPGESSPKLFRDFLHLDDAGIYTVSVTNVAGTTTSQAVEVEVRGANRSSGDWPTFGGGSRRLGHSSTRLGTHSFTEVWTAQLPSQSSARGTAIAEGRIFVTLQGLPPRPIPFQIMVYELSTGVFLWGKETPGVESVSSPTFYAGKLFVTQRLTETGANQLHAFNAVSGNLAWNSLHTRQNLSLTEAPTVGELGIFSTFGRRTRFDLDGNRVYAEQDFGPAWSPSLQGGRLSGTRAGFYEEYRASDGGQTWRLSLAEYNSQRGFGFNSPLTSRVALVQEGNSIFCVDRKGQSLQWSQELQGFSPRALHTSPAMNAEHAFAIVGSRVECYDLGHGERIQTYDVGDEVVSKQPLLTQDHLFASTATETRVFSLETGELVQTLPKGGLLSFGEGHLVVAGSDGTISAFFANDVPDFISEELPEMVEDEAYTFQLEVAHEDEDENLTFTLLEGPDFLTITPEGEVRGIFESDRENLTETITVEVSDGVTPPVSRQLTLNLRNVNDHPVIVPFTIQLDEDAPPYQLALADLVSDEETPFADLQIEFDWDDEGLVLPDDLIIEDGSLKLTLALDQNGSATITLTVTDAAGAATSQDLSLEVAPVNDAPRIVEGFPISATANPAGDDIEVNFAPFVFDPDEGDRTIFSIGGNSQPNLFRSIAIDGTTGVLSLGFAPYLAGQSVVTLAMTDREGAVTSQEFTVILPELPLPSTATEIGPVLNRQTGLYAQPVIVTNVAERALGGFVLGVSGLTNGYRIHGHDGNTITYAKPLQPGESVTLTVEYHSQTSREIPTPEYNTETTLPEEAVEIVPGGIEPDRVTPIADGSMLLEFQSLPGRRYQIQYTPDLQTWYESPVIALAVANRTQWLDQGLPKTDCHPSECRMRAYRVVELSETADQ